MNSDALNRIKRDAEFDLQQAFGHCEVISQKHEATLTSGIHNSLTITLREDTTKPI